jgi:hypothetical protein
MQIYYGPKQCITLKHQKLGAQLRYVIYMPWLPQNLLVYQKSRWLQIILGLWNLERAHYDFALNRRE